MILRKLNALARLVSCMIIAKWRTLMNAFFFKSQFNCTHWYGCAVIDKYLIKIDLLNGFVSIHHQNILQSAIEMIKTLKGGITEFIKGIFKLQTKFLTIKWKGLNSISLLYIQLLMVLKAIHFLDQKYGLALSGEPWIIKKQQQQQ